MNIFDTHAHYDDEKFDSDRDKLLLSLKDQGVTKIINAGCDMQRSLSSIELSKKYDFMYASVGIHPHSALEESEKYKHGEGYIDLLRGYASNDKVVAIGEIGLDYHYDFSPRDVQKQVFIKQLELAKELDKPVIIHSREATLDMQEILLKYQPKGVVHCFTGSKEIAQKHLEQGLYLGFTGVVTFSNAKKILGAVDITPLDKILLETDCPYMAPVPYRGQRCSSQMIIHIANAIASIKGISTEELINTAHENGNRLFRINN